MAKRTCSGCGCSKKLFGGRCAPCLAGGRPKHGDVARTTRGRFTGTQVPAPNPGMNPFAPQALVRLDDRWRLGDAGAEYEFNVKLQPLGLTIPEDDFEYEAESSLDAFEQKLRKKYPWIGQMGRTGRSGGWLSIEDPKGKMTKAKLKEIVELVEAGKRQFIKDLRNAYPARGK